MFFHVCKLCFNNFVQIDTKKSLKKKFYVNINKNRQADLCHCPKFRKKQIFLLTLEF